MRWTNPPTHRGLRRFTLAAVCAVNLVLLAGVCVYVHAQQRAPLPGSPGYVAPAAKAATPAPKTAPAATAPAPATTDTAPAAKRAAAPVVQRTVIVLDPAHGGPETGAMLNDHTAEKDVTLAFANRLRSALQSHNFTVLMTRDGDPANGLTTMQRAEIANHAPAIACLVLHATATGNGVHLFTSALAPAEKHGVLPWATAQAAFVSLSTGLQKELNTAFGHAQIATLNAQADVAPLDNLTCPAVAVEIAPYLATGANNTIDVSDPDYQEHVAETVATALVFWRGHGVAGGAQ
jgi:N-acetylmuramoyl-L-alanine amidase